MAQLMGLLLFLLFVFMLPLQLALVLYKPRRVDWAEFAVISALLPLGVSFNVLYLSIAVAVVLTVVNVVVYRRDSKKQLPLGKDLARLCLVPAMFFICWSICFLAAYAQV